MKKILVYVPSLFLLSINALVPVISDIAASFPQVSASTVQLIVSLPSIVAILSILLAGRLSFIMAKQTIVFASLLCMLLGGVLPFFFHRTMTALLVWSMLFGFGLGGISPLSTALIKEAFPPEQHGAAIGAQAAVAGAGGMLFSFLGGRLSSNGWHHAYLSYLLILPALVCVIFLPSKREIKAGSCRIANLLSPILVFYIACGFFLGVFTYAFHTNISLFIRQNGIGDTGIAGNMTTLFSAAGILGGMLTGLCIRKFRSFTLTVCMWCAAAGLLLLWTARSAVLAGIAASVFGLAFSLRMPSGYLQVTRVTPEVYSTMAITFFCCSVQAGNCLSPFLLSIANHAGSASGLAANKILAASIGLAMLGLISFTAEKVFALNYQKASRVQKKDEMPEKMD